jgi:hypothetical protein
MYSKLNLYAFSTCGQGSYGKVIMAMADELDVPLAIK